MSSPVLEVEGLTVAYGPVQAVQGLDLRLEAGAITTLLGANGAGKTSTLLALSGVIPKAAGRVRLLGEDITGWPAHRIVAAGMVQVPEGRATLGTMTVRENLLLGAYTRRDGAAGRAADLDRVLAMFPRLQERIAGLAGNLSGGEQQMLAIGRALMARPRLLLLDEPSMGLAPLVVRSIFRTLKAIHAQGTTIFLVEQNVRQALRIASHGIVLENGRRVLEGSGRSLLEEPRVQQAYLGA